MIGEQSFIETSILILFETYYILSLKSSCIFLLKLLFLAKFIKLDLLNEGIYKNDILSNDR